MLQHGDGLEEPNISDAVFFKLDCYIKTLHAMGLCEWKSFKDILKEDMLNMDEVSTDTTKHHK
jgi:hypothetical protein